MEANASRSIGSRLLDGGGEEQSVGGVRTPDAMEHEFSRWDEKGSELGMSVPAHVEPVTEDERLEDE